MTNEEKELIVRTVMNVRIDPEAELTVEEMQGYVGGFRDARAAIIELIGDCYRALKTD